MFGGWSASCQGMKPRILYWGASSISVIFFLSGCGYTQSASAPANSNPVEYYVATTGSDSNDGSTTKPWRTISYAAGAVKAGDTVHVLPGVYNESVFLDNSGTTSQRIRFISDTQWGARVTGDGSGNPSFQIRKADDVDVVGFEVTNVNGFTGIESLASYSHIAGNLVHDVSGGCKLGQFNLGGAGINLAAPGHDVDVIGNVVHDVGDYLNPHGCETTHGVYVENSPSPDVGGYSTRVWNNIIYHNESDGITSWHCATQMVLVNNISFENGKTGIFVGANDPGCTNDRSVINNNIVVHNGWHDLCTYTDASQCPIGNHSGKGGIFEGGTTGANNKYWNDLSYQNFYNGVQDDGVHLSTGTQLNAISGIDPQFVNYQPDGTGNYHLQSSSPAIDQGTSMAAPPNDFEAYPRPYGAGYDIGAFEWHP
jgi:pectate disaccharide-lyase